MEWEVSQVDKLEKNADGTWRYGPGTRVRHVCWLADRKLDIAVYEDDDGTYIAYLPRITAPIASYGTLDEAKEAAITALRTILERGLQDLQDDVCP